MKAIKKTAFAVYSTDDRGYSYSDPISIYPFKAAAEASSEYKAMKGYGGVSRVELIQFEDVCYILEKEVRKEKVINSKAVKLGVPQKCYSDYSYVNSYDETTVYIVGDDELISYLNTKKKKESASISTKVITKDEDSFFILASETAFTIKPFLLSRELAIANALDKLTEEERKLLGL